MNLHIHLHHSNTHTLNARSIERIGPTGERLLDEVVVESAHPDGNGTVHLTPDQSLLLLSRLTQLDAQFLHGAPPIDLFTRDALRDAGGSRACPVARTNGAGALELEQVIITDGSGRSLVHLSPDQVRDLERRLTALALEYLHHNAWGGEDARAQ